MIDTRVQTLRIGCVFAVVSGKKLLLEWKFVETTSQHPAFTTLLHLSSVVEGLCIEVSGIPYDLVL